MNKFCKNCGNKIEGNEKFCVNCGANLDKEERKEVVSNTNNANKKSRIAAGLLGIFLGAFGVHNFYLGYTGKAIGQLLITVLSCFILGFISAIWGLIEGIMILSGTINIDANGESLID